MEFFNKMKAKNQAQNYLKLIYDKELSRSQITEIFMFAKQNTEYQNQLITTLTQKARQRRNADLLVETMCEFADYNKNCDFFIRQLNDPGASLKAIESGQLKDNGPHVDIIMQSERIDKMLELALYVQKKGIKGISYVKLEDRAFDLALQKMERQTVAEATSIAQTFMHYIVVSDECEIKKEIIRDILFKSNGFTIRNAQALTEQLPDSVDANDYAKFLIEKNDITDLFAFLQTNKNKELSSDVFSDVTDYINGSENPFEVTKAISVFGVEQFDVEKLANNMMQANAPFALIELAKNNGKNVEKIENFIIKNGNFDDLFKFAEQIPQANTKKILEKMQKIHNENHLRNVVDVATNKSNNFQKGVTQMNQAIGEFELQEKQIEQIKKMQNKRKTKLETLQK